MLYSGKYIPDPFTPPYVSSTPDVFTLNLTPNDKLVDSIDFCIILLRFVLLASDGVWDFMSPQEGIDTVTMYLYWYSKKTGIVIPLLKNKTNYDNFSKAEQHIYDLYANTFSLLYNMLQNGADLQPTLSDIYMSAAKAVVLVTLQVAAKESNLTLDQLLKLRDGHRRHIHDDTTVVVMYL